MEVTKITIQNHINADLTKVWEYYNNPYHITKWNFAHPLWHCPSAINDIRIGGKFLARMEAKDGSFGFDFSATYIEVVEYKKLAYLLDDNRLVEIYFSSNNGSTEVKIKFDAESQNSVEHQKQGWQSILDNFKRYVEG
jgi:uncharacterized protein YndB with AHSA1/START domain